MATSVQVANTDVTVLPTECVTRAMANVPLALCVHQDTGAKTAKVSNRRTGEASVA